MNKGDYFPYLDAREFVRNLKIITIEDWIKYLDSNKKPYYIPENPYVYDYDFAIWLDWFGIEYDDDLDDVVNNKKIEDFEYHCTFSMVARNVYDPEGLNFDDILKLLKDFQKKANSDLKNKNLSKN